MKLYMSEKWLKNEFLIKKKSPEEIAKECGVNHMTIRRYIDKFGFRR